MYAVGTLANKNALYDLNVFLFTLQLWNNELPNLYIYCDSFIEEYLTRTKIYKGELFIACVLYGEIYLNLDLLFHMRTQ
jgi:hypothetical protein